MKSIRKILALVLAVMVVAVGSTAMADITVNNAKTGET